MSWTGISLADLAFYIVDVQQTIFREDAVTDHRGIELSAVKDRYSRKVPEETARFVVPTTDSLVRTIDVLLGVDRSKETTPEAPEGVWACVSDSDTSLRVSDGACPSESTTLVLGSVSSSEGGAIREEFEMQDEESREAGAFLMDLEDDELQSAALDMGDSVHEGMVFGAPSSVSPIASSATGSAVTPMDQNDDTMHFSESGPFASEAARAIGGSGGRPFANLTNKQRGTTGQQPFKRPRVTTRTVKHTVPPAGPLMTVKKF